ncbi:MAG: phosphoribosylanthranilate isomerase [Thermodesulfobacteriota bacterium]
MNRVIKVCGIQNANEALGAIEAGANTIGLLLGVPEYVEDNITPEIAKQIVASVPESVRTVMVTHLLDVNEIIKIANYTGVSAIQVHNDLSTSDMEQLRIKVPELEIIKAIHVMDNTAIEQAKMYEPYFDMILLDTKTKDRIGGTGQTHDWNISQRIVKEIIIPVILAGGLNPQNIKEAIIKVKPSGIDANSGLEHCDGSKDFEKIKLFAREAGLLF